MDNIDLAARIVQTRRHPRHDAAAFQHLAQEDRPKIAGQAVRPAFDPQRPIETLNDWLWCFTHTCARWCLRFSSKILNLKCFQANASTGSHFP
jgi:hypothetical protein